MIGVCHNSSKSEVKNKKIEVEVFWRESPLELVFSTASLDIIENLLLTMLRKTDI